MECSCKNCVCVPICRHKHYSNMILKCDLVYHYLSDRRVISGINASRRRQVFEVLNPTKWEVDDRGYLLISKKDYYS